MKMLYNLESGFRKLRNEYILKPLPEYGFKPYRTSNIARITDDSVFQILNFQKEWHGGKTFTVNIAVDSLYIPLDNIHLEPGERLGFLAYGHDHWWDYKTEEIAKKSFIDVNDKIFKIVMPIFQELSTHEMLSQYYQKYKYGKSPLRLHSTALGKITKKYDLAHIFLRLEKYAEAKKLLLQAKDEYINWDCPIEVFVEMCNKVLSIFEQGNEALSRYSSLCKEQTYKKLQLAQFFDV